MIAVPSLKNAIQGQRWRHKGLIQPTNVPIWWAKTCWLGYAASLLLLPAFAPSLHALKRVHVNIVIQLVVLIWNRVHLVDVDDDGDWRKKNNAVHGAGGMQNSRGWVRNLMVLGQDDANVGKKTEKVNWWGERVSAAKVLECERRWVERGL